MNDVSGDDNHRFRRDEAGSLSTRIAVLESKFNDFDRAWRESKDETHERLRDLKEQLTVTSTELNKVLKLLTQIGGVRIFLVWSGSLLVAFAGLVWTIWTYLFPSLRH
jgi:hypothetical protein